MSIPNLIEIQHLNVFASEDRPLIQNMNLTLKPGQVALIQGHNGSGKTTLIRTLLGTWPNYTGSFHIDVNPEDTAYLPQLQNSEIHMPMSFHDILTTSLHTEISKEDIFKFCLLEERHLPLAWNTGSGGEKKRVLLTRIFISNPKLIFLDEPFNHLDIESYQLIGGCIKKFIELGGAAVIVSHGNQVSDFIDDRCLIKVSL